VKGDATTGPDSTATIVDLRIEPTGANEAVVHFRLSPVLPESMMIVRAVGSAIERAINHRSPGAKARVVGRKAKLGEDGWASVPVKKLSVSDASGLEVAKDSLIGTVNELGEGAVRMAQRFNR